MAWAAKQRGDTLIEVLVSMAVMSLVIVGGNALMNFGMQNAINAVEHTQVRNLIVGQAELLRYLRDHAERGSGDSVSREWYDLLGNNAYINTSSPSGIENCEPENGSRAFYLTAEYNAPSQLPTITVRGYTGNADSDGRPYAVPGNGLWIEGVSSGSSTEPYVDFHIRSCWQGTGTSVPQKTNTVLRLHRQ